MFSVTSSSVMMTPLCFMIRVTEEHVVSSKIFEIIKVMGEGD